MLGAWHYGRHHYVPFKMDGNRYLSVSRDDACEARIVRLNAVDFVLLMLERDFPARRAATVRAILRRGR